MRIWLVLVAVAACGKVPAPPQSDAPAAGGYSVSIAAPTDFLRRGGSVTTMVTVLRDVDFNGDVTLEGNNLPAGITFDPVTVVAPNATATVTLHAGATAAEGTQMLAFDGTSGQLRKTTMVNVIVAGAPGSLDESFASGGTFNTALGANGLVGRGIAVAADGGILVTGVNVGMSQTVLVKVTAAGVLDTTFGSNGIVTTGSGAFCEGIAIAQSNGKIIVAGVANGDGTTDDNFGLFQYTAAGALDTGFASSGVAAYDPSAGTFAEYHTVAVMADGSIVASGPVFPTSGSIISHEIKYSATGVLDNTYDAPETGVIMQASVMQPNSELVVVGSVSGDTLIGRYNASGGRDSGFGSGGLTITDFGTSSAQLDGVALLPGGKLIAVGHSITGTTSNVIIIRYNANGSLDLTFGTNGVMTTPTVMTTLSPNAGAVDAAGKIYFVGETGASTTLKPSVARFNSDGTVDTTFGTSGVAAIDFGVTGTTQKTGGYGIALDAIGRIVISADVGAAGSQRLGVARLWP